METGASRCIINRGGHRVTKQRRAHLNTWARGREGRGRAGGQTQPREPVLWEGLQPRHVTFGVAAVGRDCQYEMNSCGAPPQQAVLVWTMWPWSVTGPLRRGIS